jgi:acetoin utilization protein AcuB
MNAAVPMTREVIVVPPGLSLSMAFAVMERRRIRHLPVVQAGVLLGIVSDRDVLARARLREDGSLEVPEDPVALAMTSAPITCEPTTSVAELARIMTERKIDAVPVLRGSRLVGLVTSTDLLLLLVGVQEARPLPFDFQIIEEQAAA